MDEQARLAELYSYRILDTEPEKELDELAQIASAVCDTPISLVTFIDENRQWFKAEVGFGKKETLRSESFCQHTLHKPTEVLVVKDSLHDERFRDNPLVVGNANIRFYAGAPLVTPHGNVLGTLCILDNKPREINENQKKALQLLAKKAMDYLEARKLILEQENTIGLNAERLKKLTDYVPGAIYQFEMNPQGEFSFPFISKGVQDLHPRLTSAQLRQHPRTFFEVIHPQDVEPVRQSIREAFANASVWSVEFRMVSDDGKVTWVVGNSRPEKREDGTIVWYGTLRDSTVRKEYITTLEQILFDISHVMRRPVANMQGLTTAILEFNLNEESMAEHIKHLKTVSNEMDTYMRKLSDDYSRIQEKFTSI